MRSLSQSRSLYAKAEHMIPSRTNAHRTFDEASSVAFPNGWFSPRWRGFTSAQASRVKVAATPSLADACAKYIVDDNAIDNPSLLDGSSPATHLHPSGKSFPNNAWLRFPRYVYIINPTFEDPEFSGFKALLQTSYQPLSDIGASLVCGGKARQLGYRPWACMVPVQSVNVENPTSGGTLVSPVSEEGDYRGGDLYIAYLQPTADSGLGLYNFNGLISGTDQPTYFGFTTNSIAPRIGPTLINLGFTVHEAKYSPLEFEYKLLLANSRLTTEDAGLAQGHIDRYRKFRLCVYHPDERFIVGNVTFNNTWDTLINAWNPNGHRTAIYDPSDLTSLANQIVADAADFFTT